MHIIQRVIVLAVLGAASTACVEDTGDLDQVERATVFDHGLSAHERRGRDIWFENTYGGEKFFAFLAVHPDPAKRIRIAFAEVLATPRAQRFAQWGLINDPDCSADPAGGHDLCA